MDRKQAEFKAQALARELHTYANGLPAAWAARAPEGWMMDNLGQKQKVTDPFGEFAKEFKAEVGAAFANLLKPLGAIVQEARAATPAKVLFRPSSAADATRVNGEVSELHDRTKEGIIARLAQAREEDDVAFLARAVPLIEDRMQYAKPLQGSTALSDALIDAKMHLEAVPEVVARAEHIAWCDELESEVNLIASIAAGKAPGETLSVYVSTESLPLVLPRAA